MQQGRDHHQGRLQAGRAHAPGPGRGWLCAPLALACGLAPAQAQTVPAPPLAPSLAPSQVTPGGNRQEPLTDPRERASDPAAVAPATGLVAPPGAERVSVILQDVTIERAEGAAALPGLAGAEAAFRTGVTGRRLLVAEVYAAAARLEAAYAAAGYLLVRITIPPQRTEDGGTLRVRVIDAAIEAVDVAGVPPRARRRVSALLAPLVGRRGLRLAELDRRLTLAGMGAGLALRSALQAGTGPGTSRLVVAGTLDPAAAALSWDNSLPAVLGRNMVTASLALNDRLGLGEQLSLIAAQTDNPDHLGWTASPYAMAGATLSLPLGQRGASLALGYLHARTLQAGDQPYLDALGHFSRASATLTTLPVARHDRSLSLSLAVDVVAQRTSLPFFPLAVSRDHYASLRLGAQAWQRRPGGYLVGELRLSQGLAGRRSPLAAETPLSQPGARSDYTKLEGRIAWQASLDRATRFTLTARGQTGFGSALFLSEKLALAAPDAISATLPGGLAVDSGLTLRDELSRIIALGRGARSASLTPYAFGSLGFGRVGQPAGPTLPVQAQALGAGARFAAPLGRTAFTARIEYGRCFCAKASGRDEHRVGLALGLSF